jgi:hypothetical protein
MTFIAQHGLPTQNVLVPVTERVRVFGNVEAVLDLLPSDHKKKSVYVSKFIAAAASGLFDSAACSFDPTRGVYVPFSETVYLLRKLQKPLVKIETLTAPINQPFPYTYFTNPLVLPDRYDAPDFEIEHAPAPKDRLTNAGFIVITSELDCERIEEFEQNLDWSPEKTATSPPRHSRLWIGS